MVLLLGQKPPNLVPLPSSTEQGGRLRAALRNTSRGVGVCDDGYSRPDEGEVCKGYHRPTYLPLRYSFQEEEKSDKRRVRYSRKMPSSTSSVEELAWWGWVFEAKNILQVFYTSVRYSWPGLQEAPIDQGRDKDQYSRVASSRPQDCSN